MLPVGWLVLAVLVAIAVSMWVTFTLTRLDRLHARVDAARAALDAQLVRRAAALRHAAESGPGSADRDRMERVAAAALGAERPEQRQAAENAVGRILLEVAGEPPLVAQASAGELREAAARVQVARRFYNDAVRDTRALRARRTARVLHLAGRVELPQFFDIDDTMPDALTSAPATTETDGS